MPDKKKSASSGKKRKESGPLAAAGLMAFYENYKSKIEISPTSLVIISAMVAAAVIIARMVVH
ncbi:preprotein translocase subunit Sec61beta [Acidilobus sp.]|uniref:preprotein translocase subunit Sec61beta n=1 Tax=Acidilobus sp. TaxID=1872109 RepID=UPI003D06E28C